MYLLTWSDIVVPKPKHSIVKHLFCSHRSAVAGQHCNSSGVVSAVDNRWYIYCTKCGARIAKSCD